MPEIALQPIQARGRALVDFVDVTEAPVRETAGSGLRNRSPHAPQREAGARSMLKSYGRSRRAERADLRRLRGEAGSRPARRETAPRHGLAVAIARISPMLTARHRVATDTGERLVPNPAIAWTHGIQRAKLSDQIVPAEDLVAQALSVISPKPVRSRASLSAGPEKSETCCMGCSIGHRVPMRGRSQCPASGVLMTSRAIRRQQSARLAQKASGSRQVLDDVERGDQVEASPRRFRQLFDAGAADVRPHGVGGRGDRASENSRPGRHSRRPARPP